VVAEPLAYGLFRAAERSAWHMELRDVYVPDDPDWLDWQALATRLGEIRKDAGLTGRALALLCGWRRSTWS
jgi:hypothetical protein